MPDKYPMTPAGRARLQAELKRLKEVDRPANSKAIEIARGHGDLSENADYDAAKEEQGMIEARVRELETKLALSQTIDPTELSGDVVKFGATVTVADTDTGDEQTYTIVGEDEADLKLARISIVSPLARALIGKTIGDDAIFKTPKGKRQVEVVDVKWLPVD